MEIWDQVNISPPPSSSQIDQVKILHPFLF